MQKFTNVATAAVTLLSWALMPSMALFVAFSIIALVIVGVGM